MTPVQPWAVSGRRSPLLPESSAGPASPAGEELLPQHLPSSSLRPRRAGSLFSSTDAKPAPAASVCSGAAGCGPGRGRAGLAGSGPRRSSAPGQQRRRAQLEHPRPRPSGVRVGGCYGPGPLRKPCWQDGLSQNAAVGSRVWVSSVCNREV